MPLVYHRGTRNFGDAMNPAFWPRVVAHFDRLAAAYDVYGIGTVLQRRLVDGDGPRIVLGSGVGYGPVPVLDATWHVAWVRGPLSAAALGLPPHVAIGDPALLLPRIRPMPAPRGSDVVLMPHHASDAAADHARLAAMLGWRHVPPTRTLDEIVAAFAGARLVVTESLSGALLADAMRIPWLPFVSSPQVNAFKWRDACASLGVEYRPAYFQRTLGDRARMGAVRRWRLDAVAWLARRCALVDPRHRLGAPRAAVDADYAAAADVLAVAAAAGRPQLSSDARLASLQDRMLERLAQLPEWLRERRAPRSGERAAPRRGALVWT